MAKPGQPPLRVLVVEDDADLREQFGRSLRRLGAQPRLAADAQQALEVIQGREAEIDFVLTDVRMPGISGLELLERVQLHYELPVAIVTGHGDLHLATDALRAGAVDFLHKPVGSEQLRQLLERVRRMLARDAKRLPPIPAGAAESMEVEFTSHIDQVPVLVRRLSYWYRPILKLHGVAHRPIDLALTEALVNAIVHGNLEVPSRARELGEWDAYHSLLASREADPAYGGRRVCVRVEITGDSLTARVRDEGPGFDFGACAQSADMTAQSLAGRGLIMIRSAVDELHWNERGNEIQLRKRLVPPR